MMHGATEVYGELAAILDYYAMHQEPIYIVGNFNIRLDRLDEPCTCWPVPPAD
jgi:hypothetical protein